MLTKPSHLAAAVGWASVLMASWLLFTRKIPSDLLSWILWVFFLIFAVLATSITFVKD